jgi:tRNA (adenine22-N1)-methyltransferase
MQLSKRLQTVADLVTPGNRVADVGCDHAYTSIYLAKHHIAPYIIAMDVNQGPIDRARENIIKYGYDDRIEVRKSDGLEKLNPQEVDTILIAGMGGALTVQILTEYPEVIRNIQELVLQPQAEIHKVRQLLQEQGFIIIAENMVKEDGKYYSMMKAVPVNNSDHAEQYLLTFKEHFLYGRLLLEQRHQILREFLLWDFGICEDIIKTLTEVESEHSLQRQKEIEERMHSIGCGLKYFDV